MVTGPVDPVAAALQPNGGLTKQLIDAVSRHVLTALAGVAVSRGLMSQDQATAIMGGLMALVAVAWSMRNKVSHQTAVQAALYTPVPANHPLDQTEQH